MNGLTTSQENLEALPPDDESESLLPARATVGGIVLACGAFSTLLSLVWMYLPDTVLPFAKTSLIGFSAVTLLRLFLSLLVPVIFFAARYHIEDTRLIGRNPGLGALLLSFLAGAPATLILVALHNLIVRYLTAQGITIVLPAFFYASKDMSAESQLLALASAFLIPVIMQELFFRGLFFSVWPRYTAVLPKILLSAILFALFMQNPVDFIPLLLLGILLGYIRHATNNFLCPVITQISMLLTYFAFSGLLPYLDYVSSMNTYEPDMVSLYTATAAIVMSLLALLPVLAQIRRMSVDAAALETGEDNEDSGLRGQFGWSFGLGLVLFATSWVLLLKI